MTNINLSELMSVEADHYVQQTKYIVNSNQLEASVAEELMNQRRIVKQDHRAAKEANWSQATSDALLASLTKLKNHLDSIDHDIHLKAVELFRKVRAERFKASSALDGIEVPEPNPNESLEDVLARHQKPEGNGNAE